MAVAYSAYVFFSVVSYSVKKSLALQPTALKNAIFGRKFSFVSYSAKDFLAWSATALKNL
jgi:hypothetical protein